MLITSVISLVVVLIVTNQDWDAGQFERSGRPTGKAMTAKLLCLSPKKNI